MQQRELDNIFTYHSPKNDQADRYTAIREKAKEFASFIQEKCPESREKSLAFTAIQQSVMWANAAIAINE